MSSKHTPSDISDTETDPGYRSRSQSRRARRKKTAPQKTQKQPSKDMPSVPENGQADAQAMAKQQKGGQQASAQSSAQAQQPQQEAEEDTMQPFEWIGNDSTSMDGPVTYARAQRGEIPKRPGNPDQRLKTAEKGGGSSDMMDKDGLKLRIELNIDVEIELKARIQGDLTLALL